MSVLLRNPLEKLPWHLIVLYGAWGSDMAVESTFY